MKNKIKKKKIEQNERTKELMPYLLTSLRESNDYNDFYNKLCELYNRNDRCYTDVFDIAYNNVYFQALFATKFSKNVTALQYISPYIKNENIAFMILKSYSSLINYFDNKLSSNIAFYKKAIDKDFGVIDRISYANEDIVKKLSSDKDYIINLFKKHRNFNKRFKIINIANRRLFSNKYFYENILKETKSKQILNKFDLDKIYKKNKNSNSDKVENDKVENPESKKILVVSN